MYCTIYVEMNEERKAQKKKNEECVHTNTGEEDTMRKNQAERLRQNELCQDKIYDRHHQSVSESDTVVTHIYVYIYCMCI